MEVSETATEKRAAADPTSDPTNETEAQHIRIVLLGKTGTGKSSFAKTILGENVFEIHHTSNPGTSECQKVTKQVGDGNITVIDTPGFFDDRNSDDALKSEIIHAIIESSDGLDAFLILFKVERFTKQENKVVSKIKDCFSEEAFKHAVVVFTHGDQLPENMEIEEFVSENQYLCDLLEKCGKRCCVVDNKYWNNNQQDEYRNNQVQVKKLFDTVKDMVRSGGRYSNEMLQEVKRMKKRTVLKILAGIATGVLLGALLGVPHMVARVILELRKHRTVALHGLPATAVSGITVSVATTSGTALDAAAVSGITVSVTAASGIAFDVAAASGVSLPVSAGVYAAAGAAVGGCIGYQEAVKAKSVNEAAKNTAEALIKPVKQVLKRPNTTHETKVGQREHEVATECYTNPIKIPM